MRLFPIFERIKVNNKFFVEARFLKTLGCRFQTGTFGGAFENFFKDFNLNRRIQLRVGRAAYIVQKFRNVFDKVAWTVKFPFRKFSVPLGLNRFGNSFKILFFP